MVKTDDDEMRRRRQAIEALQINKQNLLKRYRSLHTQFSRGVKRSRFIYHDRRDKQDEAPHPKKKKDTTGTLSI